MTQGPRFHSWKTRDHLSGDARMSLAATFRRKVPPLPTTPLSQKCEKRDFRGKTAQEKQQGG